MSRNRVSLTGDHLIDNGRVIVQKGITLVGAFLGGGLAPASWNPGEAFAEVDKKRFLKQRFSQRFNMILRTLFGKFGQAGVMDYVLVLPAVLRFMCAGAMKIHPIFGGIVAALLAPLRLISTLINFVASLALAPLVTAAIHVGVKVRNRISRRRADSSGQIESSSDMGRVSSGFQRLSSVPNTGSMTAEEYEANLAADTVSSAPTIVTYGYGRTGANPLSFSVGNGLGTSSAAAANPRGDASTATLRR